MGGAGGSIERCPMRLQVVLRHRPASTTTVVLRTVLSLLHKTRLSPRQATLLRILRRLISALAGRALLVARWRQDRQVKGCTSCILGGERARGGQGRVGLQLLFLAMIQAPGPFLYPQPISLAQRATPLVKRVVVNLQT
jgi:hypothetical protein